MRTLSGYEKASYSMRCLWILPRQASGRFSEKGGKERKEIESGKSEELVMAPFTLVAFRMLINYIHPVH